MGPSDRAQTKSSKGEKTMIKVLYVGKNEYWAGILAEALEGLAAVVTTPSSDEMIEGQADLIVLDALQIKQFGELVGRGYHHKVVVATASPYWEDARYVFLGGALDYIIKTINLPTLRRWFSEEILPTLETTKRST